MLEALTGGGTFFKGEMRGRVVREDAAAIARTRNLLASFRPRSDLGLVVKRALPHLPHDLALELMDKVQSVAVIEAKLFGRVLRADGSIEELGLVGTKVVTTAFVNALVDAFLNTVELENFKYHGLGTGSVAEAVSDTALGTELTTEYTGNVRATGTTTEGATGNIYKTVATNTLDGNPAAALREHGVFSQAATGGGTLLDRTVFAAVTLSSGDAYESTYELTCTAGG